MSVILVLISEDRMVEQTRRPSPVVSHQAGPGEVGAGTLSGMNLRYSAATDRHLLRQTGSIVPDTNNILKRLLSIKDVCVSFRVNDRAARAFGRRLAVIGDQLNREWASRKPNRLRHLFALSRTRYKIRRRTGYVTNCL